MTKNINTILKQVLKQIKPPELELKEISKILKKNLKKVKENTWHNRINADIFVGGSFAKGTVIKKDRYDIDVFIRFDKKYKNTLLSEIAEKLLQGIRTQRIHGSRDYFRTRVSENLFIEFVPVRRIKNPKEAENVTDLSYFHVNYIKKKIRSEKMLDEIRLAKAFCYANGAYGAESYIQGFSGYGLELLIYHYKSFIKFIKEMAKVKANSENKIIIDIEKHYKKRSHVLLNINAAKLQSPIILVDPTYKQRNVLAALSLETFEKFQQRCKDFLRKPDAEFFEPKGINLNKIKNDANKRGYEFILFEIRTNRQAGDIAGSKLLKFYRHLCKEIERFFDIKAKGLEYDKDKTARIFIVAEEKPFIIIRGPLITQKKHTKRFRNIHRKIFVKDGRLYAKLQVKTTLEKFIKEWSNKYRKKMIEMGITNLRFVQ